MDIFSELLGTQKGNIAGRDLIFLQKSYHQRILRCSSPFYKDCLLAVASLDIKKGIDSIDTWDKEHIFYNSVFITEEGKTFPLTGYCEKMKIYLYEQLLQERSKKQRGLSHDKAITRLLDQVKINTSLARKDMLVLGDSENDIELLHTSQQVVYEQLLFKMIRLHISEVKWLDRFNVQSWDDIWNTVFNFLSSN